MTGLPSPAALGRGRCPDRAGADPAAGGEDSRRRGCHSADAPLYIPIETPAEGSGGASE